MFLSKKEVILGFKDDKSSFYKTKASNYFFEFIKVY